MTLTEDLTKHIIEKLSNWKGKLIDLTRRNNLLNFRPLKRYSLRIVDEIPSEIFKQLVIDGDKFRFKAVPKKAIKLSAEDSDASEMEISNDIDGEEFNVNLNDTVFSEYDRDSLDTKHKDLFLQTNLLEDDLERNLKYISREAKQVMEEQGYNVLFLALGILRWYESPDSDIPYNSPILMVPVEIIKKKRKTEDGGSQKNIANDYELKITDEDVFVNLALILKLKIDFGLELDEIPEDLSTFNPIAYYKNLQSLIIKKDRWKVLNTVYLGLFSFAKFTMYKDMDKFQSLYLSNKIIQGLVQRHVSINKEIQETPANELDIRTTPHMTYQVLDADSSQQEVIEVVKAGCSLVIQGPPGTGKSQTITNIISEALAQNKTILFVSEKMAALDVVYSRLKDVGLGDYCLEVHSHKSGKLHVLGQIQSAFESQDPGNPRMPDTINSLCEIREQLNRYPKELHEPHMPLDKSVFWGLGKLASLSQTELLLSYSFERHIQISSTDLDRKIMLLSELQERVNILGNPNAHPFKASDLRYIDVLLKDKIENSLKSTANHLQISANLADILSKEINQPVTSFSDAIKLHQIIHHLSTNHCLSKELFFNADDEFFNQDFSQIGSFLELLSEKTKSFQSQYPDLVNTQMISNLESVIDEDTFKRQALALSQQINYIQNAKAELSNALLREFPSETSFESLFAAIMTVNDKEDFRKKIQVLIENIYEYSKCLMSVQSRYDASIFQENIEEILSSLKLKYGSLISRFSFSYFGLLKIIKKHLNKKEKTTYASIISDIETAIRTKNLLESINKTPYIIYTPLGILWKNEKTNIRLVDQVVNELFDLATRTQQVDSYAPTFISTIKEIWFGVDSNSEKLIDVPTQVFEIKSIKTAIDEFEKKNTKYLGNLWQGYKTDLPYMLSQINWLKEYCVIAKNWVPSDVVLEFILDSNKIPNQLSSDVSKLHTEYDEFIKGFHDLVDQLNINIDDLFDSNILDSQFAFLFALISSWFDNLSLLSDWISYKKSYERCKNEELQEYIDSLIVSDSLTNISKIFEKGVVYYWIRNILHEKPSLREFESISHEKLISAFREIDTHQIDLAKARLKYLLYKNKPDTNWEGSNTSELGFLQRQFRLKKRHASLRRIFSTAPKYIQSLTPCFLMSPLSLSQFIDPSILHFDIVIFDEASQISPEDSLCALVRGDQLVVAGDSNQMPPSNYFKSSLGEDTNEDDEIEYEAGDLESILDELLSIGFKQSTLRWHYRSKDETLINFSNYHFYKNHLITFPNSFRDESLGIHMRYIQNGVYDRGKSKTNLNEAREVVKEIVKHYKTNSSKSLGVAAFSQSQQRLIMDLLDEELRDNPKYEEWFNKGEEKLFIKNLETIQGDERDVILISIGFGKDHNGKFSLQFGPLSRDGGERRLNVLITRARYKLVLFSSVRADEFDLTKTNRLGVTLLKKYLEYAASGDKSLYDDISYDQTNTFDETNIFEKSVYDDLCQKGYQVVPQVGCSGYKIDFGILHPEIPSKFVLAIECDGATYHSSSTARDRDRLRQAVLEKLGWKFHRIWSTDWFTNKERELKKLIACIDESIRNHNDEKPVNMEKAPTIEIAYSAEIASSSTVEESSAVIPYRRFEVSKIASQEDFYELYRNYPSYSIINIVSELIEQVIVIEAPIHMNELASRVAECFEISKVGSKVLGAITKLAHSLHVQGKILVRKNFVYKDAQTVNPIRNRSAEGSVIDPDYFPPDEIEQTIILTLNKEFSINQDDLIQKSSRLFGFQRCGPKLYKTVEKAINGLAEDKNIFIENGVCRLCSTYS